MTESTDPPHPQPVDTLIVHWNRASYQILEHRFIARKIQLIGLLLRPI